MARVDSGRSYDVGDGFVFFVATFGPRFDMIRAFFPFPVSIIDYTYLFFVFLSLCLTLYRSWEGLLAWPFRQIP